MLIASIKWKPVNRKVFARVECILIHNLNELAYSIPLPTNTSLEIALVDCNLNRLVSHTLPRI